MEGPRRWLNPIIRDRAQHIWLGTSILTHKKFRDCLWPEPCMTQTEGAHLCSLGENFKGSQRVEASGKEPTSQRSRDSREDSTWAWAKQRRLMAGPSAQTKGAWKGLLSQGQGRAILELHVQLCQSVTAQARPKAIAKSCCPTRAEEQRTGPGQL